VRPTSTEQSAKVRRQPFADNQLFDPVTGARKDPGARIWSDLLLLPGNPDPPVDRRWQIATRILEDAECARVFRRDDRVSRALEYLGALQACRTDAERDALATQSPDLDAAYRLHTGDKLTRATVDALLLACQSVEQVAVACGLTPAALTAYAALFFEVLDKLGAVEYLLIHALGGNVWDGSLTEADGDVFVRLFGLLGGPPLVRSAVAYFRGDWSVPERLADASPEQLQELVGVLKTKALVQVHVLPYRQCVRAVRLFQLAKELEAYAASRPGQVPPAKAADDLEPYASLPLLGGPLDPVVEPAADVTAAVEGEGWWVGLAGGAAGGLRRRGAEGRVDMPWAQRGPHRYFFSKRVVRGRVVRRSLGRRTEAQLAAALATQRQREREAEWARRRQERGRWNAKTETVQRLIEVSDLLMRAALLAAGYHQHEHGDWRKRHGSQA
jgi:hypothetical protein